MAVSAPASDELLSDLRSDKGMDWVPERAWLTKVRIDGTAADIGFDLAIAVDGGVPSLVDAGFAPYGPRPAPWNDPRVWLLLTLALSLPILAAWVLVTLVRGRGPTSFAGA